MPAAEHTHSPTAAEIMEYLDGEGTADSRAAIEMHLVSCAHCQSVAADQRTLSADARAWNVEPAPASLHAPADSRAHAVPPRLVAWARSRYVLAGLTAAAAVLVVVSFTVREKREASAVRVMAMPVDAAKARVQGRGSVVGGVVGGLPESVAGRLPQAGPAQGVNVAEAASALRAPMVIRTATLRIVAKDFDGVRSAVEAVVTQANGFIDEMTITGDTSTARALRGTLRVPGDRLPDTLARLRRLGQVVEDAQGSQDVTDQIVDLDARLASARATERRLADLLKNRTGKLSDVLEVEREMTRVRLEIERLDAQRTNIGKRVTYAAVTIEVMEERKAGLDSGPLSLASRIRIAFADGLETALETVVSTVLFVLRVGPTMTLLMLVAGAAWLVRRARASTA
jgi:anti-sigma factor RsiW